MPPDPSANRPKTLIVHLERGELNRLGFDATIEGVKGTILVDTGASSSMLNENKYGFLLHGPKQKLPGGMPATTHVNDMKARVAFARDFHLGGVDLGGSRYALVPEDEMYENLHYSHRGRFGNYDGAMGENFLQHYQAVVDCSRQLLYLSLHPLNTPNLAPVLCANGWTRVPMAEEGRDFSVPCQLNGRAVRLIVDTGAAFTTFDRAWLDDAHMTSGSLPMRGSVIGNAAEEMGVVKLDRLRIGDYTATNVQIASSVDLRRAVEPSKAQGAADPIVGLLGSDTLGFNGAIIDVGGKALYLKPVSGGGR